MSRFKPGDEIYLSSPIRHEDAVIKEKVTLKPGWILKVKVLGYAREEDIVQALPASDVVKETAEEQLRAISEQTVAKMREQWVRYYSHGGRNLKDVVGEPCAGCGHGLGRHACEGRHQCLVGPCMCVLPEQAP